MLFAVAGIGAAFLIGRRVSGGWGGALAAMGILSLPVYRFYSTQAMTDVPGAALVLFLCLLFISLRTAVYPLRAWMYALAGLLTAVCSGFHVTFLALLAPFALYTFLSDSGRRAVVNLLCLGFPVLLLTAATLCYNNAVFGSPLRNGYHYWCSVPYDYFNLTFSMSYLRPDLVLLARSGLPILIIAAILLLLAGWRFGRFGDIERPMIKSLVQFTVISMAPIAVFHVFYFFSQGDGRFLLPIFVLLICILGSTLGLWLRALPRFALLLALLVIAAAVLSLRLSGGGEQPARRLAVDFIRANTESNAVVVSTFDPVYLDFITHGNGSRRFIPLSRRVEYASKLITTRRIDNPVPPPSYAQDHRCRGLVAGGAVEAVEKVADENPETLLDFIRSGVPVYLYGGRFSEEDLKTVNDLRPYFVLHEKADLLYEMQIPQK